MTELEDSKEDGWSMLKPYRTILENSLGRGLNVEYRPFCALSCYYLGEQPSRPDSAPGGWRNCSVVQARRWQLHD